MLEMTELVVVPMWICNGAGTSRRIFDLRGKGALMGIKRTRYSVLFGFGL